VNVLADVLSRAIADNLNNKMPKEHPISKQWAKVLSPIPENFGVSHNILYKFLTRPLQSETQDIYNRQLRKLMEPKSVFTMYKESQAQTPEQKFHSAQVLLHQWFSDYAKKHKEPEPHVANLFHAKMELDLQTQQICLEKIQEIMDKLYSDIKNTPLFRTLQKNLQEVSEKYLLCLKNPLTETLLGKLKASQKKLLENSQLITETELANKTDEVLKINFIDTIQENEKITSNPIVHYSLHPEAKILPKICNASNGLDIPLQENVHFKPYEIKKVNLKIKFQFPKHHCALLMNKSSARTVFNINVQLGLIDVGYHDYVIAVLQNMSEEPNILYAGTAVTQLLLLPAKIPHFNDEWPETNSTRGSFGSTGQNFQEKVSSNYIESISNLNEMCETEQRTLENCVFSISQKAHEPCPLLEIKAALSPEYVKINNIKINFIQNEWDNTQEVYDF
jgi:dUTPase